jgi:hypothetical protein
MLETKQNSIEIVLSFEVTQLPFAWIVSFACIVQDCHDETFRVDTPRHLVPLSRDESHRDLIVAETTLAWYAESTEATRL